MTVTVDVLPAVTSTADDAAALLGVDPFALPAGERQEHVVALQALAARMHAAYLAALVSVAGPVRQAREVVVEHGDDASAARAAARAHGGEVVSVGREADGMRTVTLLDEMCWR